MVNFTILLNSEVPKLKIILSTNSPEDYNAERGSHDSDQAGRQILQKNGERRLNHDVTWERRFG